MIFRKPWSMATILMEQEGVGGQPAAAAPEKPSSEAPPERGGDGSQVPEGAPDRAPSIDRSGETMLGEGSDDERKVVVPADWPDDWRARAVKDAGLQGEAAEKAQKKLERLGGVGNVLKSYLALEQKLSSGEFKKSIDDAETDEEKAELRAAQGVPESWDKYEIPELEHTSISRDDPDVQGFLERMHSINAPQAHVKEALAYLDDLTQRQEEARFEGDKSYRMSNEDTMRAQLGEQYRPSINLFHRVINDADGPLPRQVAEALMTSRDDKGNRVVNNAAVATWLIDIGKNHYGDGALITGEQAKSMQNREEEIKAIMQSDFSRYTTEVGPTGKTLQKEYEELIARKMR